jgi:peptidoglycan-associated lipoprotein
MSFSRKAGLAILGLTLVTAGCRRNPPETVATPPQAPPPATTQPVATTPPPPPPDNSALERQIRGTLEQMVFFDYDSSSIRADSRQTLDAKVPLLRQYTGFTIVVEGHADERGSTEYNLALGSRRAASVVDYLVGFGLQGNRFRTFSYGEERPLAMGSDESAWARNRRAEFRVSGGMTEQR